MNEKTETGDKWEGGDQRRGLVESCLFEGKSVYWSYNMTKKKTGDLWLPQRGRIRGRQPMHAH